MKRMILGSDRSGFPLKEAIKEFLKAEGYEVEDVGMHNMEDFMPYYVVAPKVAERIRSGEYEKGILCCGTGAGMAIVANKFQGVYAVPVEGSYTARMASVVNQANVLTLGGWVIAPQQALEMVKLWLDTPFTEGFPEDRQKFLCNAFKEVQEIEKKNMK